MNKSAAILIFAILMCLKVQAQFIYLPNEYGFGITAAQYFGDLNQRQSFTYVRPGLHAFYKRNLNPYVSLKVGGAYARIGAADKYNKSVYELTRNLSFENNVVELSFAGEFNFFRYTIGEPEHRFTPYINFGIGGIYHDPYVNYAGQRIKLKPLGTEGQLHAEYANRRYSNFALIAPVGIGIKYWVNAGLTLSFEVSNRFTSTDYLDDVSSTYVGLDKFPVNDPGSPYIDYGTVLQDRSNELGPSIGIAGRQRGISGTKDQFLFANISLSIRLKDYVCIK